MGQQLKVAFVGRSKTATTACARYLQKEYKWVVLGLDDELDKYLRHMYSVDYKKWRTILWEDRLRFYDAIHRVDPDIFVNRAIHLTGWKERNVVIPDARYLNEIKRLDEAGFIFIRVTVPKDFNKGKTNINQITNTTNPGALAYYEWFATDANLYVNAKYTVHTENRFSAPKSALDIIVNNLTEKNTSL